MASLIFDGAGACEEYKIAAIPDVEATTLNQPQCSCATLEKLEGASVPAYIGAFLEDLSRSVPPQKDRYRCRICGREWEKHVPDEASHAKRPSLVRIK